MLFTTPAGLPTNEFAIGHREQIMLVGSCFASNIGNKLKERKFRLELNPFGVQYNPLSIAEVLKRVATGEPFKESSPELFFHNGMWHSCMHHSDFSRESKEEIVNCINSRLSIHMTHHRNAAPSLSPSALHTHITATATTLLSGTAINFREACSHDVCHASTA